VLILVLSICGILIITNCSKRNSENESRSPKLKSDTITISLPSQDSLALIKRYFGSGILQHMKTQYNPSITDFTILNDSICFDNDTCTLYKLNIQCYGFTSKQIGLQVRHSIKKGGNQSVYMYEIGYYSCTKCNCTASCQLIHYGCQFRCLCFGYEECCLVLNYIWFTL